jgi:hypothetical protein
LSGLFLAKNGKGCLTVCLIMPNLPTDKGAN